MRWRRRGGFTLIEAALTTVIVGTGVLAIVAAQQAYHKKNDWAQRTGTGVLLANELRELTLTLPVYDPIQGRSQIGTPAGTTVADFNNLLDFAGTVRSGYGTGMTFSPPINALRQTVPDMAGWSQEIRVEGVLDDYISATTTAPLGSTNLVRVTATVYYQAPSDSTPTTITQMVWIVAAE